MLLGELHIKSSSTEYVKVPLVACMRHMLMEWCSDENADEKAKALPANHSFFFTKL